MIAPAVESTETWCIAAFRRMSSNPELWRGQELCQKFMTVLHQSENAMTQEHAFTAAELSLQAQALADAG